MHASVKISVTIVLSRKIDVFTSLCEGALRVRTDERLHLHVNVAHKLIEKFLPLAVIGEGGVTELEDTLNIVAVPPRRKALEKRRGCFAS